LAAYRALQHCEWPDCTAAIIDLLIVPPGDVITSDLSFRDSIKRYLAAIDVYNGSRINCHVALSPVDTGSDALFHVQAFQRHKGHGEFSGRITTPYNRGLHRVDLPFDHMRLFRVGNVDQQTTPVGQHNQTTVQQTKTHVLRGGPFVNAIGQIDLGHRGPVVIGEFERYEPELFVHLNLMDSLAVFGSLFDVIIVDREGVNVVSDLVERWIEIGWKRSHKIAVLLVLVNGRQKGCLYG